MLAFVNSCGVAELLTRERMIISTHHRDGAWHGRMLNLVSRFVNSGSYTRRTYSSRIVNANLQLLHYKGSVHVCKKSVYGILNFPTISSVWARNNTGAR